jgi:ABC-type transport system involved in multi-copper enzyme maturation permease subunit
MVGSVFHQELLLGGRRGRLHVLRWVYVAWLVLQIFFLWFKFLYLQSEHWSALHGSPAAPDNPASAPGIVGAWFVQGMDGSVFGLFFPGFVRSQMIMLLLATPAFVAGAVADEKRRGTLQYLLTADIDTRHLILGKMFGRVAQVALLAVAGLPVFALMAGFAGIEPLTLVVVLLVLLAPMFALSAAAILASVQCRHTSDAVLVVYFFSLIGCLIVGGIGGPLRYIDPMYAVEAAAAPWLAVDWPELAVRLAVEVAVWGLLGCACLAVAIRRLRPVYIRELEAPTGKAAWQLGERVPIGDDPVRWRERYVERLMPAGLKAFLVPVLLVPYTLIALFTPKSAPDRAKRLSLWPGIVLTAAVAAISSLSILWRHLPAKATLPAAAAALSHLDVGALAAMRPVGAENAFELQGLLTMLTASFIVGVRCSGSITGERERQTWEAVLLTPLTAKQLVLAKLWGVMGACYWYLLAYAVPAILLSALAGWGTLFWTVLWLAVTVLAMYFMGAAGVWCSAQSKSSWRSLLGTMAVGYLLASCLYLAAAAFAGMFAAIINQILQGIDDSLHTQLYSPPPNGVSFPSWAWWGWFFSSPPFVALFCAGLAVIFFFLPRFFLRWAQRWIADRERTRHWHEEPYYRRPRREPLYQPRYYP